MNLFRKKPLVTQIDQNVQQFRKCLSEFDLTLMGIGAIIGAGIFILTGIAAATKAGPAIIISYIIAGAACGFSALSYAELAASVGGCGSAYGYTYAALGELFAWIIGWDLLLEYAISVSAVSVGWSGYVSNVLNSIHLTLPYYLLHTPFQGGVINLPAICIIMLLTAMLMLGVKESARFNTIIVIIKLAAILLFILVASFNVNPKNWHPFMPFGWNGIIQGATLIFFSYIGFDAVSTAAEEAKNPQRDLPFGIITSLIICTLLYILVSGLLTSIAHYSSLNNSAPFTQVLLNFNHRFAAAMIGVGAIAGLTTVMLVMYYGLTRVFFAMARDRLLPIFFAKLHSKTHTPIRIILLSGIVIALCSGFIPMKDLAELVNIGTLSAFMMVCMGVLILRVTAPNLPRPFKVPYNPFISGLGVVTCLYLILHLPYITLLRFVLWMSVGIIIYFTYSQFHK